MASVEATSGEVCFVNIGPKERQRRLTFGLIMWGIAVAIFVVLMALNAPWWTCVLTLPFFMVGATGFFQWRDKT